jgi:hypothetical protein
MNENWGARAEDLAYPPYCRQIPPLDESLDTSRSYKTLKDDFKTKRSKQIREAFNKIWLEANSTQEMFKAQPLTYHRMLPIKRIATAGGGYPTGRFKGQGVVIVAGGPTYTPPALACVAFLQRSGCKLPIEVWTPATEELPERIKAHFIACGAVVRSLADVYPELSHPLLLGYLAKPAAILASAFEEVLLLDADNVPLADPADLFHHPLYTSNGLLMWRDFWSAAVQPQIWEMLGVLPSLRPEVSHDAGQLLVNKQRGWEPLLLTLYLNLIGNIMYPLLSYAGQGDKETYPYAWAALNRTYGLSPHGVIAVGKYEFAGPNNTKREHKGTAMLQLIPDGAAQFLHVHHPKLKLEIEAGFQKRSWQVLTSRVEVLPLGLSKHDAESYKVINAVAGVDVEAELHLLRQQMRCSPAWAQYVLSPPPGWKGRQ